MPSGWIYAVYTPQDSIVFEVNYLHTYNIEMQIIVREVKKKLKLMKNIE